MRGILDQIKTPYVDAQTLLSLLVGYQNPRDVLSRMVKKGELIRLKNGFYLIAAKDPTASIERPYEQIANLMYGPSYVSLEWALSFYGMIPEGVRVVTSVTTGSRKEFTTPLGTFSYQHLNHQRYAIGIGRQSGATGGFLIATPEKALADHVYFSCRTLDEEELLEDLVESKRIEECHLRALSRRGLEQIAKSYNSPAVTNLNRILQKL